ncbi:hypothetical protein [Methylobacillus flagellatus]|uniref:hypothetical protein n=1 Tax=Methylobacillus flagellatus TaxID=405 RepID=UPI0028687DFF|nr:hypothetical protein [Methylobacillus flagellatus]
MVDMEDLRKAYKRTGLRRAGMTFLQALEVPHMLKLLTRIAEAAPSSQGNRPARIRPYRED